MRPVYFHARRDGPCISEKSIILNREYLHNEILLLQDSLGIFHYFKFVRKPREVDYLKRCSVSTAERRKG